MTTKRSTKNSTKTTKSNRRSKATTKTTRPSRATSSGSAAPRPLAAIILAAGDGTRMRSRRVKVLHSIAGRTLVEHVARAALSAGASRVVVVVGHQAEQVGAQLTAALPHAPLQFVVQSERLGTGDAVRRAIPALDDFDGDLLILCGDVPALPVAALTRLLDEHRAQRFDLTVLSALLDDPTGYGRMIRQAGKLTAIVEHKEANARQRAVHEINSGTYCADWRRLLAALAKIKNDNAQGEYYLTDAVRLLLRSGSRCGAVIHARAEECMGVNSRRQLAEAGKIVNRQQLERLMDAGVTVIDPDSTWVDADVSVGQDSLIYPQVQLSGNTKIGSECVIRSGTRLHNVSIGERSEILDGVVATDSKIGADCHVGPFTHLRPGVELADKVKLGNFVESKKARFAKGAKASHLSYIGDAEIGENVNIGAGTITCNYDGVNKHVTRLEAGVFIGSDTQLVAPVTVGAGAYVGAGTTVTKDVPAGALAISRTEQRNIEGWAEKRRKK